MPTATRRIIRETEHVRNAERFLGGRLEDTLKPYLNERGTMSDLASAIGVQKATVNYWIMRLGIKYERVAYDESEEVRVYTREEAELADAAIDSGLDADELERIDRTAFDAFTEFQRSDRAGVAQNGMTDRDVKMLESIKQAGEDIEYAATDAKFPGCLRVAVDLMDGSINPADLKGLTRADIQVVAHLKKIGADKGDDADGVLRDVLRLDGDTIGLLRDFEDRGQHIKEFADFDIQRMFTLKRAERAGLDLESMAALTTEDLGRIAALTSADLKRLDAIRDVGWNDDDQLQSDLDLLSEIKEAGLDDQKTLDAAKQMFEAQRRRQN